MYRECAHPGTDRDLALCRHVDAEASGVVHEPGVAGHDVVSLDASKAEGVRPVRAPIFQRDSRSVCGAEQDDSGVEGTSTQRFPTDLFAGGQHVPTVAGVNLRTAAGGRFWAHSWVRSFLYSARAAPLEAGAVVTLRETKRVFRSSFLRSPAGASRRSQSAFTSRGSVGASGTVKHRPSCTRSRPVPPR